MTGIVCAIVGNFSTAVAAQIIRLKKGITAVGNAQIDTAQSKFGGASYLGDGSGDRLTLTGELLDSQYTIEYWMRASSFSNGPTIVDLRGGGTANYSDYITTGGIFRVFINNGDRISSSTTLSTGVWYHIAVVRDSSNNIKLYVNGTNEGSTYSWSGSSSNTNWVIGDNYLFASSFNGHIDELRVSKTARYTTNFTPATSPFVNDDNTLLLLHMNGTDASTFFEDDNGVRAPKGITAIGNAQIDTAQSKFGGSSALFDGTGDYLFSPSNSDFGFGTGDFTLEGWFRFVNFTNGPALFDLRAAGGTEVKPLIYCGSDGVLYYYVNGAARITGSALSATTWYHITVSRASGSTKMFVNGTQVGSTYSDSNNYGTTVVSIGIASWNTAFNAFNGHADEIRISNTARYTANFTAPTAPFVNDANTLLLIHADGTDAATVFSDDNGSRTQYGLAASGNAQLSTTRSKFGGASAYFDGNGDYIIVKDNISFASGSDFTLEFWVNEDIVQNAKYIGGQTTGDIFVGHDTSIASNRLGVGRVGTGWDADFGVTLAADTWYHVAISRSGTTVRYFVDGDLKLTQTSGTLTTYNWQWRGMVLGAETTGNTPFNGYLDEIRISNTARYTANFTAPTAPFSNDSNTVLLLHMDGSNGSTVFTDDNGKTPVTP